LSSLRIYRVSLARATSCLGSAFSLSHGRISLVCSRGRSECLDTCPKALTSSPSQCKSIYPFYRTCPVECFVSSSASSPRVLRLLECFVSSSASSARVSLRLLESLFVCSSLSSSDSRITAKKRAVDKKKTEIGGQCLQPPLEFFTDASKEHGMRQWVGAHSGSVYRF
jgi:hypothetical protein